MLIAVKKILFHLSQEAIVRFCAEIALELSAARSAERYQKYQRYQEYQE